MLLLLLLLQAHANATQEGHISKAYEGTMRFYAAICNAAVAPPAAPDAAAPAGADAASSGGGAAAAGAAAAAPPVDVSLEGLCAALHSILDWEKSLWTPPKVSEAL